MVRWLTRSRQCDWLTFGSTGFLFFGVVIVAMACRLMAYVLWSIYGEMILRVSIESMSLLSILQFYSTQVVWKYYRAQCTEYTECIFVQSKPPIKPEPWTTTRRKNAPGTDTHNSNSNNRKEGITSRQAFLVQGLSRITCGIFTDCRLSSCGDSDRASYRGCLSTELQSYRVKGLCCALGCMVGAR